MLGGLGLLFWLAGPIIQEALSSPAEWITTAVGYFLFILTSLQVLSVASTILLRVIPTFISPAGLFVLNFNGLRYQSFVDCFNLAGNSYTARSLKDEKISLRNCFTRTFAFACSFGVCA